MIALELEGQPQAISVRIRPAADGSVTLKAEDAEIDGTAKLEEKGGQPNIGYWIDLNTKVSWNVDLPQGDYKLELCYAIEQPTEGNQFRIVAGDQSASETIRSTGSWENFKTVELGKLRVPDGVKTITIQGTKSNGPVMNLRWVKLTKGG